MAVGSHSELQSKDRPPTIRLAVLSSISSDGQMLAIGASFNNGIGDVRVFGWTGSDWTQIGPDIEGDVADDRFGYSVSLAGDGQTVAIGAPTNDGSADNSGHVRVYQWTGSDWSQISLV